MKLTRGLNPIVRATGVVSAVMIIAGGVTFAALNDSVVLADNSFGTASANLSIWNGSTFTDTAPGFTINNLVPGANSFSTPQKFFLKNSSGVPLYITAKANTTANGLTVTGVSDLSNVRVKFASLKANCNEAPVVATLPQLQSGNIELPCNPLSAGAQGNSSTGAEATEGNYTVAFGITNTNNSNGARVSGLDLTFTGSVTDPSPSTQ